MHTENVTCSQPNSAHTHALLLWLMSDTDWKNLKEMKQNPKSFRHKFISPKFKDYKLK